MKKISSALSFNIHHSSGQVCYGMEKPELQSAYPFHSPFSTRKYDMILFG